MLRGGAPGAPPEEPAQRPRRAFEARPSRSTRHRVLRDIEAHGPTTVAQIAARLLLSPKTVYHHVGRLLRQRRVRDDAVGRRRFLRAPSTPAPGWRRAALLQQPGLARIHAIVADEPGIDQATVVARLTRDGWKRSTAQHRIRRCAEHALVVRRRAGRSHRLSLPDHPENARRPSDGTQEP